MRSLSFRAQIALWSLAVSATVLLSFGVVASWSLQQDRLRSLDASLSAFGIKHALRVSRNADQNKLELSLIEQFGEEQAATRFLILKDNRGVVTFRSANSPADLDLSEFPASHEVLDPQPTIPKPPKLNSRDSPGKIRTVREPRFYSDGTRFRLGVFANEEVTLFVGADLAELTTGADALRRAFLLALPGALLLIAIGAWLLAQRAIRPVEALSRDMKRISAQALDSRLEVDGGTTEFDGITRQYNAMLERLERSFHQATRFSADASHELKTPLAIMRGTLERALAESENDPNRQAVFSELLEQTDRQKAILENLLLLSRADSGQLKISAHEFDFSAALETWLEDAGFLAEAREIEIRSELEEGLLLRGDETLLQQVAHNLFSNAVRHNVERGEITSRLFRLDGEIHWEIRNSGPLLEAAELERLFERFHRGANSGTGGTGLGLSLVKEIITTHGGTIAASTGENYNLFRVTLPEVLS